MKTNTIDRFITNHDTNLNYAPRPKVYDDYVNYAEYNNEQPLSMNMFSKALKQRGYRRISTRKFDDRIQYTYMRDLSIEVHSGVKRICAVCNHEHICK